MIAICSVIRNNVLFYLEDKGYYPDETPTMRVFLDENSTDTCCSSFASNEYYTENLVVNKELDKKDLDKLWMKEYIKIECSLQRFSIPIKLKELKLNHIKQVKLFQKHNCKIQNRKPYK